jgi:hypothetical protein
VRVVKSIRKIIGHRNRNGNAEIAMQQPAGEDEMKGGR